jgi:hypothetical protein
MVGILGVGGAAAVAGLRPYSFALLALSGVIIGFSLWRTTRTVAACAPGARPLGVTISRSILFVALAAWIASTAVTAYTFFAA